ncbi:transglutaminase domain-containing protein, partial [Salmonella enterica subsp. enterica serovar Haifa]|nr:transglutaminase domain-containing protein [Salmonella enterica subsp. enterica serovar Haifa]
AAEVTAGENTDYDRLVALQNWFRAQFEYSLETPVEEGFDGTGAEAVAEFLDERSGYCVHFAGAFALMAESLGMQTRIVVGYLPGSLTDEKRGEESIFSVTSDQLHSWPEVLFPGIGWVPFEPTASLGVPTAFRAGVSEGGTTGSPVGPAPS